MEGTIMRGSLRALTCVVAAVVAATGGAGASAASPTPDVAPRGSSPASTSAGLASVIVEYDNADDAARAVTRLGGTVGRSLGIVESFAAQVPERAIAALRAAVGVRAVGVDGKVKLKGNQWTAENGANSLYGVSADTGASRVWKTRDSNGKLVIGTGVGVALIDSGVAPVKGLADSRIMNGPDLSFESQNPKMRYLDTFGHGTHMASIILGRDPGLPSGNEGDPAYFAGMAPGANLISVKVAAADGATDVSQVIAGIDWVVNHRNDTGLNIRVLNLSFGTDSTQDPKFDPLSHAVEAAWRKGIVVVVSVGNDGAAATTLAMPAVNPYVIAVGAADSQGTLGRGDDTVATFSTRGNVNRHADLVAPGKSIIGLRDPGSYIDVNYPTGLVPGDTSGRFFRGSGTSQAAAVVSGAAALLLQQRPGLTPDQVKKLLMSTASAMPMADAIGKGAGQLNVLAAALSPTPTFKQTWLASQGTGSLELARGSAHVSDPGSGKDLVGETDIMGSAWNGATWAVAATNGTGWSGGDWNGAVWSGTSFGGTSFAARTWAGVSWAGNNWAGQTWSGVLWTGATWDGRTWSARTWSGRTWSGRTWSGGYWSASIWK
jgi:serine protease AprX